MADLVVAVIVTALVALSTALLVFMM